MSDAEKLAVAAIVLVLVAALFLLTAIAEIVHSVELNRYGQIAIGRVTARMKTVRYRSVRYEFDVNGKTFTAGDIFGRENLWTSLPALKWDALTIGAKVPVRFLPDRPWISELVDSKSPILDDIACLIVGAACVIMAALCWRKRGTASTDP
jgi:uncharacterized protein DUF3592